MPHFLGIDGGGTQTTAWLVDGVGKRVGCGNAGPANPLKVGITASQREIKKAYQACVRDAGFQPSTAQRSTPPLVQAVVAGISGTARGTVHRPLLQWMRSHIPAGRYLLTTDATIVLAAALRDEAGIIVIAGTGSIAFARDKQGKVLRAGGWGIPFDDCGSGYDLGRKAVAAALRAFDGRSPQTALAESICQHFKLRAITEIVGRQLDQQTVAGIVPLVIDAAQEGDHVARQLCRDAAHDLASLAITLLSRAEWMRRPARIVMSGGVFRSSAMIRRAFARRIRQVAQQSRVELLERAPVEGAIWLARNLGRKKS